jgi:signal recognition particle subunit SEC65
MKERVRKTETELINPIFDLDGTLIKEVRGSKRLFDFTNPSVILNLEESDLTPLGILVRDSGKQFDILTARGKDSARFIRKALEKLGFNPRKIVTVGVDVNEPSDWAKVSSKRVVEKKQRIVRFILRKLVDNDVRNLEGLGELGELVTQDQTEF